MIFMFHGYHATSDDVDALKSALVHYGNIKTVIQVDPDFQKSLNAQRRLERDGNAQNVFESLFKYYAYDLAARKELLDNLQNDNLNYTADVLTSMFEGHDYLQYVGHYGYDEAQTKFFGHINKSTDTIGYNSLERTDHKTLDKFRKELSDILPPLDDTFLVAAPIALEFVL